MSPTSLGPSTSPSRRPRSAWSAGLLPKPGNPPKDLVCQVLGCFGLSLFRFPNGDRIFYACRVRRVTALEHSLEPLFKLFVTESHTQVDGARNLSPTANSAAQAARVTLRTASPSVRTERSVSPQPVRERRELRASWQGVVGSRGASCKGPERVRVRCQPSAEDRELRQNGFQTYLHNPRTLYTVTA